MNQKLIKNLKPGDGVLSFFIVRKKEIKERKANREIYLTFEFGDNSGRIRGSLWNHVKDIYEQIQVSDIVKIKGRVITFQDGHHISIEKIRKATERDNIDIDQFLPKSEKNIADMFSKLMKVVESIENKFLKNLLNLIFSDKDIKQKFMHSPAAKLWHQNYIGGLIEHTMNVVQICQFLHQTYQQIDRDILLTSAILHDIGKIKELDAHGFINYSTEGRLIGHIVIATQIVNDKISQINDFPEILKNKLLHCIISHHGQKEFGSPVVPMTLEALALYYADEIDSKMNGFLRIINKENETDKHWSNYVNLIDRFIYLGED